jgi:hypothetical protein
MKNIYPHRGSPERCCYCGNPSTHVLVLTARKVEERWRLNRFEFFCDNHFPPDVSLNTETYTFKKVKINKITFLVI